MKRTVFIVIIALILTITFFGCESLTKQDEDVGDMKSITLSVANANTNVGNTEPVTVTGTDNDNHTHNIKSDVHWNISNSGVVVYKNGGLYAKSTGTTSVKVTYENGSGTVSSNTVQITVSGRQISFTFIDEYIPDNVNTELVVEAWVGKSLTYENGKVIADGTARKVITDNDLVNPATFELDSVIEQKCFLLIVGLKQDNGNFYITHKVINDFSDTFTLTIDSKGAISL